MTPRKFLRLLEESGLFQRRKLKATCAHIATTEGPQTAEQWARCLVRLGELTAYQAAALLQDKGQRLTLGAYLLLDKLNTGGMGRIYKAEHRRMKRVVAVKLLPTRLLKSRGALARFHGEIQATARLSHPNIVTAFDAGEAQGAHFLVMEFIQGRDFSQIVHHRGPLSISMAMHVLEQAAKALRYAHGQQVVHRDIKPSNLLLDASGKVKIVDFGIASLLSRRLAESEIDESTEDNSVRLGTLEYMAPEQCEGAAIIDERADVYSLGCTLYFLLTGQSLYTGQTGQARLKGWRLDAIPALQSARPDVPDGLEAIFQRMVAHEPDQRFAAMSELLEALRIVKKTESGDDMADASVALYGEDKTSSSVKRVDEPTRVHAGDARGVRTLNVLSVWFHMSGCSSSLQHDVLNAALRWNYMEGRRIGWMIEPLRPVTHVATAHDSAIEVGRHLLGLANAVIIILPNESGFSPQLKRVADLLKDCNREQVSAYVLAPRGDFGAVNDTLHEQIAPNGENFWFYRNDDDCCQRIAGALTACAASPFHKLQIATDYELNHP